MPMRFSCVLVVCSMAIFSLGVAPAQSSWTLTTADFKTRPVNLIALDDQGAKVTEPAGTTESVVPWQQILQLERATPAAPAPPANAGNSKFTLHLTNGDRLVGQPAALEGETLGWTSPAAGSVNVKLKQVTAITRAGQPAPRRDQRPTEDVVALVNGDQARGLISAIDASGITVQAGDGTPIPVAWDAVGSVLLAAVASADPAGAGDARHQRGLRVTLADGSLLSDATIAIEGDKAILGAGDTRREVAFDAVTAIEQVNGPVAWLSSLEPSENIQTPFLETLFPARMDRTVAGEPIRFGDRAFGRGIGVHAYSRLTWKLPQGGRYKAFRTQYAIDGDRPYANVTVRVKLDDKIVHEATNFTAGKLADVVRVVLEGASTLTLEVDYGQTYDVQDRFNWIEPALLAE